MRRLFSYRLTWLVLLGLALSVLAERVSAAQLAVAPLLALTVPLWLLLTGMLALGWALRRRWVALLPLAALVLAWPQVQRGLPLHLLHPRPLAQALSTQHPAPKTLRLLSANVRIFNVYADLRQAHPHATTDMLAWLAASPADVLCLQEYYDHPDATGPDSIFRTSERLGPRGGRHGFVSRSLTNRVGAVFGLAIFSRLPVVGRGELSFGRLTQNHAMWVDVVLPGPRPDTVRVYNAHLQSMSLDEADIVAAGSSQAGLESKGRGLLRRFVRGAAARAWQADTLLARIQASPYPVLLAGDLNDPPYSYAYDHLAGGLQNAWASTGFGPGNTYHGRLPPLLRIDQQFATPAWQVLDCRIHHEIPYSDHFPVEGLYELR